MEFIAINPALIYVHQQMLHPTGQDVLTHSSVLFISGELRIQLIFKKQLLSQVIQIFSF